MANQESDMYKVLCLLSFIALCVYTHFDKSPNMTTASVRLLLALLGATTLMVVVKNELDSFLD